MIEKNRRKKNRNRKNNLTKVIVYYNVRKMCEKNPFVIKDTHLLLKEFFLRRQFICVYEYCVHGKSSWIQ